MDEIFHKVSGFRGAFDIVRVAREHPHRYGKNGELLIAWDETEEAHEVARRRSSVAHTGGDISAAEKGFYGNRGGVINADDIEQKEDSDGK